MKTIFFDCDDTLCIWGANNPEESIYFNHYGSQELLKPHTIHIQKLIWHKNAGDKIVVWSAAGEEWAREVVKVLKLEEFVDVILSKPDIYYDDLPNKEILPREKRAWFQPDTGINTVYTDFGKENS